MIIIMVLSVCPIAVPVVSKGGRVEGEAAGMIDTLTGVYSNEGVRGLYRGFLPNFLKAIPAVSVGYLVYERLKLLLKVDSVR